MATITNATAIMPLTTQDNMLQETGQAGAEICEGDKFTLHLGGVTYSGVFGEKVTPDEQFPSEMSKSSSRHCRQSPSNLLPRSPFHLQDSPEACGADRLASKQVSGGIQEAAKAR